RYRAVVLGDFDGLNFAGVLVKGNIGILENLAVFVSLRPVQWLRTITFDDALGALVRVASEKDIHVIVKASSVLLRILVHERYNNVCFAGFLQSVCFLLRASTGSENSTPSTADGATLFLVKVVTVPTKPTLAPSIS